MTTPIPTEFESILVVFQNPVDGRRDAYDDWYTNIHIRDAMRLDGAIATRRFIVSQDQLLMHGNPVRPQHWAHTIYEWESAAKSVQGHTDRAGTPAMKISRDGNFAGLRDYFYRPRVLSHGWTREHGFRRGEDILTAMMVPPPSGEAQLIDWFRDRHVRAALALPGVGSVGLFSLHEQQSLPRPAEFPLVAIYALTDRASALCAFESQQGAKTDADLTAKTQQAELTCWQPRTPRLRAEEVATPTPAALAEENRARASYRDRYLTRAELMQLLA
jgi:hypothetical protein